MYAFLIGGLLCIPAQILIDKTKLSNARILTGYVVFGVILGSFDFYETMVNFASTGVTVPLLGFGYTLAKGVRETINIDGIFGALYGGLSATSAGISASIFFALLWSFFFKSRQK